MAKNTAKKRKQQQRQAYLRLLIMAAILICVNMLAARFHWGIDLTQENRFTLSPATKQMLRDMDDVAVIDVYLKGEFPAGIQRLSDAARERLQSMKDVSGGNIVFRFSDPFEGVQENEKRDVFQQLAEKGIEGINLQNKSDEGYSEKIIFPYALVRYKGRELSVRLMENNMGMSPFENLNQSESLLEYKFASAINKLEEPDKPRIAYIMGHGEALGMNTYDMLTTLEKNYYVDTFFLPENIFIFDTSVYKAIIINKPTQPFDEKEKFKIDQYVMSGGKVLWALDVLNTPMDSLQKSELFITTEYGLNLEDMLFKYGVRVNPDLIEDLQCNLIPVVTGAGSDGKPTIENRPWIYFPIFLPTSSHPIVNNMGGIMTKFTSSIDTIANDNIKKTILLQSSKYSRTASSPVRVTLSMLRYPLKPEMFKEPLQSAAVLLEGNFTSVFNNRMHPDFLQLLRDSLKREFRPNVQNSRMIVISDGDIFLNDYSYRLEQPLEMGYWDFTGARFANKSFMLNCLEYLTDESGILEARSKDMKLRLLDTGRVKREEQKWQILNIAIPVGLVLVFASVYLFFRKRRYEKKA